MNTSEGCVDCAIFVYDDMSGAERGEKRKGVALTEITGG
jgi:hypothetical protein